MDGEHEFRFRIRAYTPETMPLGRLAAYLTELARTLGEDKAVHLMEVTEGSTVLVHKIDHEAVPKIRDRIEAVRRGQAPVVAMQSYRKINEMLGEDNGSADLTEGGAEILDFPGIRAPSSDYSSVSQRGEIDGEVQRVGGPGDPVPVLLTTEGRTLSGCFAKRDVAKRLGHRLFEPVRLYGEGRWSRKPEGGWTLVSFRIDDFEELGRYSLAADVNSLRAIPGLNWGDDAIQDILSARHGSGAANGDL